MAVQNQPPNSYQDSRADIEGMYGARNPSSDYGSRAPLGEVIDVELVPAIPAATEYLEQPSLFTEPALTLASERSSASTAQEGLTETSLEESGQRQIPIEPREQIGALWDQHPGPSRDINKRVERRRI